MYKYIVTLFISIISYYIVEANMKRARTETISSCAICMDDDLVQSSDGTCTLSCGHLFHSSCIQIWLTTKQSCPVCRRDTSCCEHGALRDHGSTTIVAVLEHVQHENQLMKKRCQEIEDSLIALRLHHEALLDLVTVVGIVL